MTVVRAVSIISENIVVASPEHKYFTTNEAIINALATTNVLTPGNYLLYGIHIHAG